MRRWVRRGLPLVAGIVLGVAGTTLGSIAASSPGPVVRPQSLIVSTGAGQIEGRTTGTVDQFLGVPYAAPPAGALRWQPPQPVTPWTGVRSALSYGGRCAQLTNGNGPRIDNEDCLYLNVYAPAVIAPGKKLPVMFMIHGGGLTTGAGDQQDGSLLASSQNIIVVSVNYRLGPFGFLSLPGLTSGAEADGNFGLLDQEAALRWVRQNIAGFGGDPGQVTIAGESAGGWSVCGLLTSPPARGLFARAIMESGSCVSQPQAIAQRAGMALAAKVGCTDAATVAACLRAVPEATLLSASSSYQPLLTVGGTDLPVAPEQAVTAGNYTKVPILIGTNHDEGRTFAQGEANLTEAQYVQYVQTTFGTLAPQVLSRYPWSAYHGPHPYTAAYAIGAIETDAGLVGGIGGCPEQNLAGRLSGTGSATYFFQFDDRHAPGLNNDLPGYQWGAGHAMELAYLWPSFTNGFSLYAELTPAQLQLSRQMLAYWGAFVRTGVPSAPGSPGWPPYSAERAKLMSLRPAGATRVIAGSEFAAEHQCSFWNGAGQGAEG